MSGPLCPDCGSFSIESLGKGGKDRCGLCGWSGPTLPRKILYAEDLSRRSRENADRARRKREGMLFFVRIWIDGRSESRVVDPVLEVLGADTADHKSGYLLMEMSKRPPSRSLAAIRKMKGVKRVSVD